MSEVMYLLRGGPFDGEAVSPPPALVRVAAEAVVAELFGDEAAARLSPVPVLYGDGWTYVFSDEEAGVLIGRPSTPEEIEAAGAIEAEIEYVLEETSS